MDIRVAALALYFFAMGLVLLVLALWFRRGRSRIAWWWVRRQSIETTFWVHTSAETVALAVLPFLIQLSGAVVIVALMYSASWTRVHPHHVVMWSVVIAQALLAHI